MRANSIFYSSKETLLAIFGTTALLLASGLSGTIKIGYPLTVKNCSRDTTLNQAPARATTVNQNSTEILYSLRLTDHVVDTSLWFGPVLDTCKTGNEKATVIAQNIPSSEGILAKKLDLVVGQFEWQIGPADTVASYEQFSELKTPVYATPADCTKDNEGDSDSVRKGMFDITIVYQEVADLIKILDVQDRDEALTASLKTREAVAKNRITSIDKNVSAMSWFSSADLQLDPYAVGRFGPAAWMAQTLGVKNVIDSAEEWPTVGWEAIAKVNPSVTVLDKMSRHRFPADNWKIKVKYLKSDPVTTLVPAIKENYLPIIGARTMNAGIRVIDGLEKLADTLIEYDLTHSRAVH